jgi:SecD/SecF fusion protein
MLVFSRLKAAVILGVCLVGLLLSALAFVPAAKLPAWAPHPHVNLGLDLQGGSYLLLEVDTKAVVKERLDAARAQAVQALRAASIRHNGLVVRDRTLTIQLQNEADGPAAEKALADLLGAKSEGPSAGPLYSLAQDGARLLLTLTDQGLTDLTSKAVQQSVAIVRRRIDETGVNEPVVARQGQNRVLVELPGVSDPGRIKRLLGSTAKMTFRLVAEGESDTDLLPLADKSGARGRTISVRRQVEVDGANLTDARATQDQRTHEWVVSFSLDSLGTRRFADVSTNHVGEPFAIVLDGKVLSAPVIREPITGGRGQISGHFTVADANDLAVLLRAGALPAPLTVVEERSVGPSLGADAIQAGLISVGVGFSLVVAFMLAAYGRFGVYAAVALLANLALTVAGLSLFGATLTLPGIAGILLALGMAVDANILVNERVREESRRGRGVVGAIEHGFRRAYAAITDANATTLIKMLILFVVGTGAVKGFAVTISLGILVSMFTAILLVRLLTASWLKSARPKSLSVGTWLHRKLFPEQTAIAFMKARHSGLILSALISLASLGLAVHPGLKWGVDFAGGVVIEARTEQAADYGRLRERLGQIGLGPVQVQQFGSSQDVLLRFEQQPGGQQQAAVDRVRTELEQVAPGAEIRRVEVVGATVGAELFQEGLLALALAGIAMFAYIAFRFEWPFAVGAVTTMFLDLTKTVGFFALTGIEFDLTSIAAVLTIMGFSINDKVVVYDRVRENLRLYKAKPLREVIDLSINETLSRTVGTSVALFLAIAPLALFGGPALHHFAVTLLFGLVLATSSSIFIAAPLLLTLGERRLRRERQAGVAQTPTEATA